MSDSRDDIEATGGPGHRAPADYIETLETLLAAARDDNGELFEALLDDLTAMREQALFRDVGRLTRQLHEALTNFQLDDRVAEFASDEFPDARQRLDQVIVITEQSAHRTMDLVEDALPRIDRLSERAQALCASPEGEPEPLRRFAAEVESEFVEIRAALSEVIISQNYQDLAGQEIRKVISLVTEVEETLINMMRVAGKSALLARQGRAAPPVSEGEQRITSQDEADELLSSLGF